MRGLRNPRPSLDLLMGRARSQGLGGGGPHGCFQSTYNNFKIFSLFITLRTLVAIISVFECLIVSDVKCFIYVFQFLLIKPNEMEN